MIYATSTTTDYPKEKQVHINSVSLCLWCAGPFFSDPKTHESGAEVFVTFAKKSVGFTTLGTWTWHSILFCDNGSFSRYRPGCFLFDKPIKSCFIIIFFFQLMCVKTRSVLDSTGILMMRGFYNVAYKFLCKHLINFVSIIYYTCLSIRTTFIWLHVVKEGSWSSLNHWRLWLISMSFRSEFPRGN